MAALARTHSAFLREAEEVLYESLYIIDNDNSLKCMKTLATNPEKAALVRFLTITYTFINIDCDRRLTTILLKSLINMHSLSDFRMKSWAGIKPIMMDEGICKILWSVSKILIFTKLSGYDSAGDTVKIIFDYELSTASTFSTFLKSLRAKQNCRYLECILATGESS